MAFRGCCGWALAMFSLQSVCTGFLLYIGPTVTCSSLNQRVVACVLSPRVCWNRHAGYLRSYACSARVEVTGGSGGTAPEAADAPRAGQPATLLVDQFDDHTSVVQMSGSFRQWRPCASQSPTVSVSNHTPTPELVLRVADTEHGPYARCHTYPATWSGVPGTPWWRGIPGAVLSGACSSLILGQPRSAAISPNRVIHLHNRLCARSRRCEVMHSGPCLLWPRRCAHAAQSSSGLH